MKELIMNPKRPKLAAEYKPLVLLVKTYLSDILSPIFGLVRIHVSHDS